MCSTQKLQFLCQNIKTSEESLLLEILFFSSEEKQRFDMIMLMHKDNLLKTANGFQLHFCNSDYKAFLLATSEMLTRTLIPMRF